ncbi:MAG: hypothetical protein JRG96_08700 [Deltaproteobacteria bacterium]|nr:hypothetical protein [Deltaproteobacteria bacterium]MBW2419212.1 hypothetical protein [Deltaproteobacteria bacterium]
MIKHWIEHNCGHAEEFTKWAERAKDSGHEEVSQHIREAAGQMDEANRILRGALEHLGGE